MFEMGTGVTSSLLSPDLYLKFNRIKSILLLQVEFFHHTLALARIRTVLTSGQVLDLLVSVSLMYYYTYTSDLSTW